MLALASNLSKDINLHTDDPLVSDTEETCKSNDGGKRDFGFEDSTPQNSKKLKTNTIGKYQNDLDEFLGTFDLEKFLEEPVFDDSVCAGLASQSSESDLRLFENTEIQKLSILGKYFIQRSISTYPVFHYAMMCIYKKGISKRRFFSDLFHKRVYYIPDGVFLNIANSLNKTKGKTEMSSSPSEVKRDFYLFIDNLHEITDFITQKLSRKFFTDLYFQHYLFINDNLDQMSSSEFLFIEILMFIDQNIEISRLDSFLRHGEDESLSLVNENILSEFAALLYIFLNKSEKFENFTGNVRSLFNDYKAKFEVKIHDKIKILIDLLRQSLFKKNDDFDDFFSELYGVIKDF